MLVPVFLLQRSHDNSLSGTAQKTSASAFSTTSTTQLVQDQEQNRRYYSNLVRQQF